MSSNIDKIPLAGSEKAAVSGARELGTVDPNEKIDVTIILETKISHKQKLS